MEETDKDGGNTQIWRKYTKMEETDTDGVNTQRWRKHSKMKETDKEAPRLAYRSIPPSLHHFPLYLEHSAVFIDRVFSLGKTEQQKNSSFRNYEIKFNQSRKNTVSSRRGGESV